MSKKNWQKVECANEGIEALFTLLFIMPLKMGKMMSLYSWFGTETILYITSQDKQIDEGWDGRG